MISTDLHSQALFASPGYVSCWKEALSPSMFLAREHFVQVDDWTLRSGQMAAQL